MKKWILLLGILLCTKKGICKSIEDQEQWRNQGPLERHQTQRQSGFYYPLPFANPWWRKPRVNAPAAATFAEAGTSQKKHDEHEMQLVRFHHHDQAMEAMDNEEKHESERQYGPWTGHIPPWNTGRSSHHHRFQETPHEMSNRQAISRQYGPFGQIPPWGRMNLDEYMRLEDDDSVTFVNHNEEEDDFDRGIQEILPRNQKYKCGVDSLGESRIVGGQEASPHSFPWSVSLKVSWGTHFCGGSIINERFILTAAHCVAWGKEILRSKVVVGAHHLDTPGSGDTRVTEHSIKKAKYHIHYNKDTTDADVAVIELREPIEFRANAVPVCLPEETEEFLEEPATVIGWGRLQEYGESSRVLREVSVKIISNEVCSYMYQPIEVTGNMLCAGDAKGGKDACQGDSGGSLNVNTSDGQWKQVGIVSWGRGCGLPEYPGVYTRVTVFRDWINRHGNMNK